MTLVEVLVAIVIAGMALLAGATMALTAHSSLSRSGERTVAVILAQQKLEWVRNQSYSSLTAGQTTESLAGSFEGYSYTTNVQVDTPQAGVKTVSVLTTSPSGRSVQLFTVLNE